MQINEKLERVGMGIDKHGLLYKGEKSMLRLINNEYSSFYAEIAKSPVVEKLVNQGVLVQSRTVMANVPGYEIAIEHPIISPVSYPFEWTPNMFKDAALTILRLNRELVCEGLCTQDAHPWNVMFDGVTPKFVDFTSIVRLEERSWGALSEFNQYCLGSLLLMAKGYPTTARALLREIFGYPEHSLAINLASKVGPSHLMGQRARSLRIAFQVFKESGLGLARMVQARFASSRGALYEVESVIDYVESLDVTPRSTESSAYYGGANVLPVYDGSKEKIESLKDSTPKHKVIHRVLSETGISSVLDIGCNRGLYAQFAASKGIRVVGIDTDELALDQMYLDSKRLGTSALPLFVNAVAPAQAVGFMALPFPDVGTRLRSELVLCLAVVHHLVFKRTQMSFEQIARTLSDYSSRYLLVEFVPKEDEHVSQWHSEQYSWYTEENFRKALSLHFSKIDSFASFPEPRVLLLCEK